MPGFNIGGGAGPSAPSAILETRRKHRWVWVTPDVMGRAGLHLKKAARPHFKYDRVNMHHIQEVAWFAGKQSWDPITLEWYDIENKPDVSQAVINWVKTVTVNFTNADLGFPDEYKATSTLSMLDGEGNVNEIWDILNSWPTDINWNELDYTSSEIQLITVQLSYDRAIRIL